jgi:pSer/pThr/pTyr-binding forkhead associated (FHA) protein
MALLILIQDDTAGVRFKIDKPKISIGRGEDNDICLQDELVSKHHAVIEAVIKEATADKEVQVDYYYHDQDSTNHSYVNEERVKIRRLSHDDIIRIGKNNFRFVDDRNDDLDATTQLHKTWIPGVYITKKGKSSGNKK